MKLAHRSQSTLALILGCAALALVAPGCGDDDDSTGAAGGSAGKANTGGKAGAASTGGASSGGKTGNGGATAQGGKTTSNGGSANGGTAVIGGAGAGGQEGGTGPIGNGGTTTSGGSANGGSSNGGSGNGTGGTITITGGSGGMGGEGGDMGGAGAGGEGGAGTGPKATTLFDFESGVQGWNTSGTGVTVAASNTRAFGGTQSLKITVPALDGGTNTNGDSRLVQVGPVNLYPGAKITLHVWTPPGAEPLYVQAVTQSNNWAKWDTGPATLVRGDWTTWTYTVPNTYPGGLQNFAVQIGVPTAGTFAGGDIFLDEISAVQGPAVCSGPGTGDYTWEAANTASWTDDNAANIDVSQSTTQHQGTTGTGSLKIALAAMPAADTSSTADERYVFVAAPNLYCGQTVTFHVWTPAGSEAITIDGYVQYDNYTGWKSTTPTLTRGDWTTFTLTVPPVGPLGIQRLGLKLTNTGATTYTGDIFVDNVSWAP